MKRLLWQMFAGTRGGYIRGYILKNLSDRPCYANQIAQALNIDNETIKYHLDILANHGLITVRKDKPEKSYFISRTMKANLNDFNTIWEKISHSARSAT